MAAAGSADGAIMRDAPKASAELSGDGAADDGYRTWSRASPARRIGCNTPFAMCSTGAAAAWRAFLPMAGPAVIASIAYMDPGNFATNIQAGAKYGYALLWVVLLANLDRHAVPGAVGQARHRHRPQSRGNVPRPVSRGRSCLGMWIVSEIAAMATDLAEFLGGAIGLSLLFHMPLLAGMVVTAIVTYGILTVRAARLPADRTDHRRAWSAMIGLCYLVEMFIAPVDWGAAALHTVAAATARRRGADDRRRHHRRDRHAARDLSAFRPDAGAHAGPRRRRPAQAAALLQHAKSSSR